MGVLLRLTAVVIAAVTLAVVAPSAATAARLDAVGTQPAPVLASLTASGGLCASGPCWDRLTVRQDATWTRATTGAATRHGSLRPAAATQLRNAVRTTRLLASPVRTGPCASASDGSDFTYVWRDASGGHVVSSCTRDVPTNDPLVRVLAALWSATT